MAMYADKPLIIQSDMTVLLDTVHRDAEAARTQLIRFAELAKRPGLMHTYRMTPLTLWNAAAGGWSAGDVLSALSSNARYGLPMQTEAAITRYMGRYGKLRLELGQAGSLLLRGDSGLLAEAAGKPAVAAFLRGREADGSWCVSPDCRGRLKQELTRAGYPVIDTAGYHDGEALAVSMLSVTRSGQPFALRDYQQQAVDAFYREGSVQGGSGVVVLPCGAGKTIVGLAALARSNSAALILTSNTTSVKQWKRELLERTSLAEEMVGEYTGQLKQVRPITIATYQIMTHRPSAESGYPHMRLFSERDWGLIVYDEVHLLPAPVFRMTAEIQATRRLGLTATLVREDGCEEDVFSLIGPKLYELVWKNAESMGHIATVSCSEIRVPLLPEAAQQYHAAPERAKQRTAAENPAKLPVIRKLLERHSGKQTLIIGQYLDQLHEVSEKLGVPLITGELSQPEREAWYDRFKKGEVPVLAVSKVANFAVDLPDAAVAIQISGSFGSRQEEAQRIGRLLRPKAGSNEAWFYTIVTEGTKEEQFARKRQLFMVEQGYQYETVRGAVSVDKAQRLDT
ncbi:DNA repair helicase XPB [Paenibacillus protaetiae]|uniref:DNA 3'-5' helicase n=1 Tax=Paenibacillus protaetiae TaxID=2509456 RepID=A0A4P6EV23_9BACL|nr:DNA repair helicase XPB [Paenibacillus protaetiae]QAY65499.1 DEAD/DEAH box helicase [Paenibacillus protaetiae]